MQVSNVVLGASSCDHLHIQCTIGAQTVNIRTSREEVQITPNETDQIRRAVIARIRSFQLENNYTVAQLRTNLAGKVFEI